MTRARVFGTALLSVILAACGSTSAATIAAPSNPPPEYKLAVIQSHTTLPANDPLVIQFREALDGLQPRCPSELRDTLAAYDVTVHDDLRSRGVDETHLAVLTHVRDSIPAAITLPTCKDVFAAYFALRVNGRP